MEQEFANQSEHVESQEQVDTQQEQTEQTPATTQDDYFEIKYNKENMRISRDEAPTYIQKGLNYDKVQQKASEYEQNLDKIAKLSGYNSHDELLQAVAEAEKQQERQKYEQAGIDPDTFNQLLEQHPDIQYAKTMKQKEQEQQQLQQEWNELTEMFPDVKPDSIPKEVWELNAQGKSLTDAYLRYNFKNLAQQKEQEALQKLQQNQASSTGSLSGGDVKHNTNIKDMPKSDFEALLRKVKNGEVRQL